MRVHMIIVKMKSDNICNCDVRELLCFLLKLCIDMFIQMLFNGIKNANNW